MKNKPLYKNLPLIPYLIAEMIVEKPYEGLEWSVQVRNSYIVKETEEKRKKMTEEMKTEFATLCDTKCRKAYENDLDWFLKIAKSKTNKGRDQLYVWLSHWLCSYLQNPESLRKILKD